MKKIELKILLDAEKRIAIERMYNRTDKKKSFSQFIEDTFFKDVYL